MNQRKAIHEHLKQYCNFARYHDYIGVCEWTNGEGFDVTLSTVTGNQLFQMTYGEFEALVSTVAKLTRE